jgi:adenylate cyclase
LKRSFWVFGVFLIVLLVGIRFVDPPPVQALRFVYFDQLQKWQPRPFDQLPVRVVDIDEDSLDEHGQWPWPRSKLAEMVTRLNEAGAATVVFDVLFLEEDRLSIKNLLSQSELSELLANADRSALPDNDAIFARSMAETNVVLGVTNDARSSSEFPQKAGLVEIGSNPSEGFPVTLGFATPIPQLAEAAKGLGSLNMSPYDTTERVRRVPMMWRDNEGHVIPSLVVEALRTATGEQTILVQGAGDRSGVTEAIRVGPFTIPTREDGSLWVRFRPDDAALYVSAHDVLTAPAASLRSSFGGSIVLIGTSAAGLSDIRTTAVGEDVPGVSIHAQMIEQILQETFIKRDDFVEGMEVLAFLILGIVLLWIMSFTGPVVSLSAGAAVGGIIVTASWMLFQEKTIMYDITFPVFGGFLFFTAMTAFQFLIADREKKMIRKSFSHYVAPEVLAEIEKRGYDINLGGELKPISVLFCDIRNFTALSETVSPTEMVSILNDVFTELSDVIMKEKGTIDKFIGDSIMAFWNAPLDVEDYARRSCRAALHMRSTLEDLNPKLGLKTDKTIELAIGISMGTACVGNVGSRDRFDYSAIGDVVNRAARIEAGVRQVGYDILVSEDVKEAAPDFAFLEAGGLKFKGVSKRVPLYAVIGEPEFAENPNFKALRELHLRLLEDLRNGGSPDPELLDACKGYAVGINRRLETFYDQLSQRTEDFMQ